MASLHCLLSRVSSSAVSLSPVYVTAALVASREDDVLACDDDMASLHCLLSRVSTTAVSLFPVYVTAALVASREDDVLACDDDMASLHCLLSRLPDALPFEDILVTAQALHDAHPPEELEPDVIRLEAEEEKQRRLDEERMRQRAAARVNAAAARAGGGGGGWLSARVRRWVPATCRSRAARRYCLAACTVLLGVYVYYRPDLWR
ncbi:hypothetical protein NE865_11228 [Phthorimaea operculella]|nr:hypothetical protein NE865_11228 [Phthorimaea operculella]